MNYFIYHRNTEAISNFGIILTKLTNKKSLLRLADHIKPLEVFSQEKNSYLLIVENYGVMYSRRFHYHKYHNLKRDLGAKIYGGL